MPKTITEQNLRALIDLLITEGKRVVGPKQPGTMTLSETILSFEKDKDGVRVRDVDTSHFPETVLVGALPCDAAAPRIMDAVFSWDYHDEFYLQRRRLTTIIGLACTRADDACFCTMVGLSPTDTKGSDLFLTPLTGGGYACQGVTDKGEALFVRFPQLFDEAQN